MTALTIKQARENLPEEVAQRVSEMAKEYHTRKISFQLREYVYIAEDCTYTGWYGKETGTFQAGGEWHGYAACNKDVPILTGAFVIEKQWFMGKVFITVYHNNGQKQVA